MVLALRPGRPHQQVTCWGEGQCCILALYCPSERAAGAGGGVGGGGDGAGPASGDGDRPVLTPGRRWRGGGGGGGGGAGPASGEAPSAGDLLGCGAVRHPGPVLTRPDWTRCRWWGRRR